MYKAGWGGGWGGGGGGWGVDKLVTLGMMNGLGFMVPLFYLLNQLRT